MDENPYKSPIEASEEIAPVRVSEAEVSIWRYAPASAFAAFIVSITPPATSWATRIILVGASIVLAGVGGYVKRVMDRRRLAQEDAFDRWR